ncbi:MAG TPA: TolC family protein [Burkholderiaceae bacterium]|nr:TolC family protein [Burkholderiaceae bacterium]
MLAAVAVAAAIAPAPACARDEAQAPSADGQPELSLSLSDARRILLERSRDLGAAQAALDAAEGALFSAARKPNPVLTIGAGSAQAGEYRPRDLDRNVRLEQLIERGNKRQLRTDAARQAARAARMDLGDVRRRLGFALAQAYYGLKSAQEAVDYAQANADAFARTLDVARRRLKAGDAAQADVSRIEVDAGQADNDLRQARAEREAAQVALASILAREADARRLVASDPWPEPGSVEPPAERIAALLERRPDVQAATARLAAAEARFEGARALRTRDFSVGVFADQNRLANGGTTFGVSVSVPLLLNNDYTGEIRQADAERVAARIELERARGDALAELRRAQSAVRASAERVERLESRILPSARAAARATEFAYSRGAIPLTDLLDARRSLKATERDLADARAARAIAVAALEASLPPTTPDATTPDAPTTDAPTPDASLR